MENVDLLDRNDPAPVILFTAICATGKTRDNKELWKKYPGGKGMPIRCTIGDVEVDIIAALNEAWKRAEAHLEEDAKKIAVKMLSLAGLMELHDNLYRANEALKEHLQHAFDKAGLDVNVWEDY